MGGLTMSAPHCERSDIVSIVEIQLQITTQHHATLQSCCTALHCEWEAQASTLFSQPSWHGMGWELHHSVMHFPKLEVSSPIPLSQLAVANCYKLQIPRAEGSLDVLEELSDSVRAAAASCTPCCERRVPYIDVIIYSPITIVMGTLRAPAHCNLHYSCCHHWGMHSHSTLHQPP